MSDTSSFHAVLDRIEDEIGYFSIEPLGKIEIPMENLPSEVEEGSRVFIAVTIDAEGTQYLGDDAEKGLEDLEAETPELQYMDDLA